MRTLSVFLLLVCAASFAQEIGARYLVVTHDNFYDAVMPLAEWKHKKGLRTKVVKLSQIGSDASQIKTYIENAYNTWQIPPEFVLLVGAPNYLPFPSVSGTVSDNYYTNMDGDIYNEILSGRLTVHNEDETQTVVNKILLYERTPVIDESDWFTDACLIARIDNDAHDDSIYWSDIHHAKNYMIGAGYNDIDTFSQQYGNNASDVIQAVNDGRSFVLFRGQGVNNWWTPFDVNPHLTQNGARLPIVLSITCTTIGTGSTPAVAEQWLLTGTPTTPRGGAGYFATTTVVIGQAYLRSAVSKGFFNALFRDGKRTFGEACEGGRTNVYQMYGDGDEYRGFTTLGDPEMNIWTAIPESLDVTHDTALFIGDDTLHVLVLWNGIPVESTLVCAMLDTIIYEYGYTSDAGQISFYLDQLMPGALDLTVTGKNFLPYEAEVPVIDTGAYLIYSRHIISDSLANGNGLAENGETILLRTVIQNIGTSSAGGVIATVKTEDTLVSMIDSAASFGDIAPLDSASGLSPFVFSVSPFCPSDHAVDFTLWIHDAADNIWQSDFSLIISGVTGVTGPDAYGYYIYDDTDTLSGNAPVYNWFEIAPPGPGAVVSEITNEDADTVTYALPFTFRYYGQNYNSIGLCSNGFLELGQSTYRFGDNGPIPSTQGPARFLAPFWDDLDPSQYGDIYYYYDTANHRYIVEYEDCAHYYTPTLRETFQVILLDEQYYPTPTDDGEVLYLYSSVADATSNTVGLEDHTQTRGLEYVYNGISDPNAAPIVNQRALLITTRPPAGTYDTPWLHIVDYTIDDSNGGNSNGLVEPDETFDMIITIRNDGDTAAYNVSGTLRTADPDAQIIDSLSYFVDIGTGANADNGVDPLTVHASATPADSSMGFTLHMTSNDGAYQKTDYFTVYFHGTPNVEETEGFAQQRAFSLSVYPNPFSKLMYINFEVDSRQKSEVSIKVYDVAGRLVKQWNDPTIQQSNRITWDGVDDHNRKVPSGIYFVQLTAENNKQIEKVILLK
ncbi:hypothetical protein AMJ87_02260 [candidate division WOR_3 bacterium SM23_60]|uniref:Gingipain domain-containing protein n=1 Tax=candidate division WOR_3 bacterium SM23_60 TaxID=1703780 RepID=A0A0S8GN32_UNCW3|nr:MAG: hypothetical protein AMJ87_02260 [candidate division WOR_3 bacterium SM23_60]